MLCLSMDYWRVKSIDRFCRLTNIYAEIIRLCDIMRVCYHNVLSGLRSLVYSWYNNIITIKLLTETEHDEIVNRLHALLVPATFNSALYIV